MTAPAPYAVLQKDAARPSADQIRRAFRSFSHLTDADAIRLAANAQGILQRRLSADTARAFHRALLAEGVAAEIVPEAELQLLPQSKALHRLALTDAALEIYDLRGQPAPVAWRELALVAAGALPRDEISHAHRHERSTMPFAPGFDLPADRSGVHRSHGESRPHLVLELVLAGGETRYEINADEFPFKYILDRPDFSKVEKFVWLVREISQRAPGAVLNRGARDVQEGITLVRGYPNRQMFIDEMTWLLWNDAQMKRLGAGR